MNEHCKDTWHAREKGESSNDLNDRLIRMSAIYYDQLLVERQQKCVLVTNDRDNKQKAAGLGIACATSEEYFSKVVGAPELSDKLAKTGDDELVEVDKRFSYVEHIKLSELNRGVRAKRFRQGKLKISRSNYLVGRVHTEDGEVLIQVIWLIFSSFALTSGV